MIEGKVGAISRDLDVFYAADLGPEARSAILVDEAERAFAETDAINREALGVEPPAETFVDGSPSRQLATVQPDGVISRTYDALPIVLSWLGNSLWQHSPVLTGEYQQSHRLLADGNEIAHVTDGWQLTTLPKGVQEFVFIPTRRYARMLEPVDGRKPWSKKAPDGIYHAVATLARPMFLAIASISFTYRGLAGMSESAPERRRRPGAPRDMRQPVLLVIPK